MKVISVLLILGMIALTGYLGYTLFLEIRGKVRARKDKKGKGGNDD